MTHGFKSTLRWFQKKSWARGLDAASVEVRGEKMIRKQFNKFDLTNSLLRSRINDTGGGGSNEFFIL